MSQNLPQTTEELRAAAQNGDPRAQFELGRRYFHGDGVERDPERAAHWLHRASSRGHFVARIYLNELIVEADAPEAQPAEPNPAAMPARRSDAGFERWLGHAISEMRRGESRRALTRRAAIGAKAAERLQRRRRLTGAIVGGALLALALSLWSSAI